MVNELEMSSEDVAIALGHQDGGSLVRRLYGTATRAARSTASSGAYADAASGSVRENRPKQGGSSPGTSQQESLF
jgi:hypothetical protein